MLTLTLREMGDILLSVPRVHHKRTSGASQAHLGHIWGHIWGHICAKTWGHGAPQALMLMLTLREMGDILLSVARVSAHHWASSAPSPWAPLSSSRKMSSMVGCRKYSLIRGILGAQ